METEKFSLSTFTTTTRIWYGVWGVRLVSLLIWLMGGINLLSAIQPAWMDHLKTIIAAFPLVLQAGNRLTLALAGLAVCLLAANLWRHKLAAWLLTVFLLVIATVLQFFREPGLAILLPICILILLLSLGYSFYGKSDAVSVYEGLSIVASAFIVSLSAGVVGFMLEGIRVLKPVSLLTAFTRTMFVQASFYNPGSQPVNSFSWYFAGWVYIIGIVSIGSALLLLTRPVVICRPMTVDERLRVAEIVEKYGRSIVAPQALFTDKQYFFSQGGSVIAYGVRGRGALVLGDPIGPVEDAAAAISAFRAYCARNDWQPSFLYINPDGRADYWLNGFTTLCIAYEAMVPLASFTLEGGRKQGYPPAL